ncbi:hypothetical protein IQE94_13200 [Synechocystis sp. PCC 7339]|uniref:hypothetical protein n=1 Tax=Synechocystis sp. PCC 7339 TaxID=2782213 RepID=UPI001CBC7600|nr:hypothetical protein [Synechocystis sp. PCC 7339]UAJ72053.1 hypothetical protein IQE94_13200 [Synechocystis sp. PCC 7339]
MSIKQLFPEIKNAIKVLIRRGADKDNLQIINDALSDPEFDNYFWENLFDSQGAKDAIEQKFYSTEMIRLLTLRSTILPETLGEFILWLTDRKKQSDHFQIAEQFQSQILAEDVVKYSNLCTKNYQGVQIIIPQVKDNVALIDGLVWLFSFKNGLWHHSYRYLSQTNFEKIITGELIVDDIWTGISDDFNNENVGDASYLNISQLFEKINNYKLASFFYYLAVGSVPERLSEKLTGYKPNNDWIIIYGHKIKKESDFIKCGLTHPEASFLLFMTILISVFVTRFSSDRWFKTKAYNSSLEIITSQVMGQEIIKNLKEKPDRKKINQAVATVLMEGLKENPHATPIQQLSCQVAKEIDSNNKCVTISPATSTSQQSPLAPVSPLANDIDTTNKTALGQIVSQLKEMIPPESQRSGEQAIKETILEIIREKDSNITNFDYIYSISQGKEAIKKYQTSKKLNVNGVMSPGGQTATRLKCDAVQKLGSQYFPDSVSDCN